jgi:hypothetical protein
VLLQILQQGSGSAYNEQNKVSRRGIKKKRRETYETLGFSIRGFLLGGPSLDREVGLGSSKTEEAVEDELEEGGGACLQKTDS